MAETLTAEPVSNVLETVASTPESGESAIQETLEPTKSPSTSDSESTKVETSSEYAVKLFKRRGIGRLKHLVHIGAVVKPRKLTSESAPLFPTVETAPSSELSAPILLEEYPGGNEARKPAGSPLRRRPIAMRKLRTLVYFGVGSATLEEADKEPESPTYVFPVPSPISPEGVAAIREVVPPSSSQSISPSQLAELIDISMASEAAMSSSPDDTASFSAHLPSIEAVLSSELSPTTGSVATVPASPISPLFIASSISFSGMGVVCSHPPFTPGSPPSPASLAAEIRTLLRSMPFPPSEPQSRCPTPQPPETTETGQPIPPPPPDDVPIPPRLVAYLNSREAMSGTDQTVEGEDQGDDKSSTSVWDVLDTLSSPWLDGEGTEDDQRVMLYFPLNPTSDSAVSLAKTRTVEIEVPWNGSSSGAVDAASATAMRTTWPFDGWLGKTSTAPAPAKKIVKVFVPSTTQLSVEVMWWGYRLYLPPPILVSLTNDGNTVSKEGALVTTALQFLLDHLPTSLVPVSLRPVLLLLTKLVPYIGYLGSFLSWSIGEITTFNKGYGVKLTATWLLPVALIPTAMVNPSVTPPSTVTAVIVDSIPNPTPSADTPASAVVVPSGGFDSPPVVSTPADQSLAVPVGLDSVASVEALPVVDAENLPPTVNDEKYADAARSPTSTAAVPDIGSSAKPSPDADLGSEPGSFPAAPPSPSALGADAALLSSPSPPPSSKKSKHRSKWSIAGILKL